MSLLASFVGLLLWLQGPGSASSATSAESLRVTDDPALIRAVAERARIRAEARRACMVDGTVLRERILTGNFDPVQEASRAASRGCFGFFVTYSGIPSGFEYAPGLNCRPNGPFFQSLGGMALLNFFSGSDVIQDDLEVAEHRARWAARIAPVVKAYNPAVLAHPAFPYRDICRPANDLHPPPTEESFLPAGWGFRGIVETSNPADVHEAARRGTLQSLRRIIEADSVEVHMPDILRLTPLAWAVIYNRTEHARLLLKAGAHPLGWPRSLSLNSPIMIARLERNDAMTVLMRPGMTARGLKLPEIGPRLDETRSSPDLIVRTVGDVISARPFSFPPKGASLAVNSIRRRAVARPIAIGRAGALCSFQRKARTGSQKRAA